MKQAKYTKLPTHMTLLDVFLEQTQERVEKSRMTATLLKNFFIRLEERQTVHNCYGGSQECNKKFGKENVPELIYVKPSSIQR